MDDELLCRRKARRDENNANGEGQRPHCYEPDVYLSFVSRLRKEAATLRGLKRSPLLRGDRLVHPGHFYRP